MVYFLKTQLFICPVLHGQNIPASGLAIMHAMERELVPNALSPAESLLSKSCIVSAYYIFIV